MCGALLLLYHVYLAVCTAKQGVEVGNESLLLCFEVEYLLVIGTLDRSKLLPFSLPLTSQTARCEPQVSMLLYSSTKKQHLLVL